MSVDYFYCNERTPGVSLGDFDIFDTPSSNDPPISKLTDRSNPVYNFNTSFIDDFQKVTSVEVAQSQPYISLCSLDAGGNVLVDFNKEFFMKPADIQNLSKANRYGDRPSLSFKKVALSSDLAAGAGLSSWTKASLSLVIHKPDIIGSTALKNLLFTGTSLRLVYGWNSPNEFLNTKSVLLINVNNYRISFNAQGEAEITLDGYTHVANFSNVFVGDDGSEVANSEGIEERQKDIKEFITYTTVLRFRPTAQGQRDAKVMQALTTKYKQAIDRASQKVQANYASYLNLLREKRQSNASWFPDVKRRGEAGFVGSQYVTVHDIVGVFCGKTLTALSTTVFNDKDFRIVYGSFNDNCGTFKGTSVADFPIHWTSFESYLKELNEAGVNVPTLQAVFNILCTNFIGNQFYWDNFQTDKTEEIDYPRINFYTSSHFNGSRETIQLALIDINQGVPITMKKIRDSMAPLMSEKDQERAVIGTQQIPVIRFGHANSFVKNISINHEDDEYVKALLINRAGTSTVTSIRQPFVTLNTTPDLASQALQLPLKGEMETLGHVNWLPGRFFYISSGIFFIDGVYSIMSVVHDLDSSDFKTHITFLMH